MNKYDKTVSRYLESFGLFETAQVCSFNITFRFEDGHLVTWPRCNLYGFFSARYFQLCFLSSLQGRRVCWRVHPNSCSTPSGATNGARPQRRLIQSPSDENLGDTVCHQPWRPSTPAPPTLPPPPPPRPLPTITLPAHCRRSGVRLEQMLSTLIKVTSCTRHCDGGGGKHSWFLLECRVRKFWINK